MSIYFEKRKVVIPGEVLAEGKYRAGAGTYKDKDSIRAAIVGLPDLRNNYISVIPLSGAYIS